MTTPLSHTNHSSFLSIETPLMKGSHLIVKALEREGVDVVFGYPGDASMELHQALTLSKQIRMVLSRHEQGAAFAANGYARATGKVGVCLSTSGPGATNLITAIMDAKMDSVPLVAITGQVTTQSIGMDVFQETDIVGATMPCVKHSYLVNKTEEIPAIIAEAFYIALTGRKGPVLIDVPKDVQQREVVADFDTKIKRRGYNPRVEPARSQITKAVKMIAEARRPVIYAGGGIIAADACSELLAFAEKTGIPVATTLSGIGCFPENHPLCLDMLGMHGAIYANIAINNADLVIVLGARFGDRVAGNLSEFCKHARIIHVDIDASEINKVMVAHVPIQGDVKQALPLFLEQLEGALDIEAWVEQTRAWKKEFAFVCPAAAADNDAIIPQSVILKLKELAPEDTIVSVGVGQHQLWTAQFYRFSQPRTFLCSCGLGAMGFGLPAGLGAQLAFPGRFVVDIDGDGSFLMNLQELQTLKTENIPLKVIVLNNKHLGMVAPWEDGYYGAVRVHTYLGEANFAEIAHGFGIDGQKISRASEVEPAIRRMLAYRGPYVLDVHCPFSDTWHGHVVPMIPKGKTYLDTIMPDGTILRDYFKKKG